jgi:excisionase family DNA binding protein
MTKRAIKMQQRRYTVEEIAQELGVHPDTVRRWIRKGELEAIDLGGSAGYRITQEALERFLRDRASRPKDE